MSKHLGHNITISYNDGLDCQIKDMAFRNYVDKLFANLGYLHVFLVMSYCVVIKTCCSTVTLVMGTLLVTI